MRNLQCFFIHLVRIFSVIESSVCFIYLGYLFRRTAAEDLSCIKALKSRFRDKIDRSERVAAELIEIIMYADTCQPEHPRHAFTELGFSIISRSDIITLVVLHIRCGKSFTVQLTGCLKRNLVYLDEEGRDHVMRKSLHQLLTHIISIYCNVILVVCTKEALISVFESSCSAPIDIKDLLNRRFDLGRLDSVTVDLDHISASAEKNKIA